MKREYRFVNEVIEIEVDGYWEQILIEFDCFEGNNNKKEHRRHVSISVKGDEGYWLASSDNDPYEMIDEAAVIADELRDRLLLHKAIEELNERQKKLIDAIYFKGMTITEYADKTGVSQPAISQQLGTVIKKLKLFFKKTL